MLSNNKIKYLRSLDKKKFRLIENKIILDGLRLIKEGLNQKINFESIWINEAIENTSTIIDLTKILKQKNISYFFESEKNIQAVSNTKNSQGVIGLIFTDKLYNEDLNMFKDNIVVLDQISDPGNLGTIIRTCAWFGIDSILLTKNSGDIFNSKCVRSAVGGHFYIKNSKYVSPSEILSYLKENDYEIYCADLDGDSINNIKTKKKWALVLGSEAHGLDKEFQSELKITIPNYGKIESLNVSIASGIILNQLCS